MARLHDRRVGSIFTPAQRALHKLGQDMDVCPAAADAAGVARTTYLESARTHVVSCSADTVPAFTSTDSSVAIRRCPKSPSCSAWRGSGPLNGQSPQSRERDVNLERFEPAAGERRHRGTPWHGGERVAARRGKWLCLPALWPPCLEARQATFVVAEHAGRLGAVGIDARTQTHDAVSDFDPVRVLSAYALLSREPRGVTAASWLCVERGLAAAAPC